ncbi:MAG: hypothetical protein HRT88_12990 [Lentisphaeraceae bacterium]|nr:hypothetical protein [Lentisphaeraceae bacterium]
MKIPSRNFHPLEHDGGKELLDFIESYQGRRLIIYFVSHQNSSAEIILADGSVLKTQVLAQSLNKLKVPTLVIFDTCYAALLKQFLRNDKVSVYYASSENQVAYDFRLRGQKPSLTKLCKETRAFIKGAWNENIISSSPYGFFFLQSIIEMRGKKSTLGDLFESIFQKNQEIRKIPGLARYPQIFWDDKGGWGKLRLN